MKSLKAKKCITCGQEFIPNNQCQKHCCDACRREAYSIKLKTRRKDREFVCELCGAKFVSDYKRKYCCEVCMKEASRQRKRKPKENNKNKPTTSLAQINELARAEGLNYGQYVAKMGL